MSPHTKGVIFAILGSVLWGASGIGGQFLMQDRGVEPEWFASVRMIGAGILLLALDGFRHQGDIFSIWRNKKDALSLLLFAVVGMLGVQYTYFKAIALANAATATILQYMMPFCLIAWESLTTRRLPSRRTFLCLFAAVGGTILLVTHGEWGTLAISAAALAWGLSSALAAAFYVAQPKEIIRRTRSSLVVGWGMLVGGLAFSPIARPWAPVGTFDTSALLALAFVIIFGTAAAFWIYLASVETIEPSEAGLLNSVEPLSSIAFSILFFSMAFGAAEAAGSLLIIAAVGLIARSKGE